MWRLYWGGDSARMLRRLLSLAEAPEASRKKPPRKYSIENRSVFLPLKKIGTPQIAGATEQSSEEKARAGEAAASAGITLEAADTKEADEEAKRFESQLDGILSYIDTLTRYNLDGVEPTAHAMPVYDVLRADEPRAGLTQDQALSNAPRRLADQIQIPKVIE